MTIDLAVAKHNALWAPGGWQETLLTHKYKQTLHDNTHTCCCRENNADTAVLVELLHNHTYKALVLDAPAVQFLAAHAPSCDLYTVGDPFNTFDTAGALSCVCVGCGS